MGLSDAKTNDSQAGLETSLGAVLAALSGINVVSGPGMMDFESCQSLEKLVIDNEICGMVYRLISGIAMRDDPIATDLFEDFSTETQFLTMPHTKKWYRQEHIFPKITDRDTYDYWASLGKKSMADRAAEEVLQLIDNTSLNLTPRDVQAELKRIMLDDARGNNIEKLPEVPGLE
jgi:trimethylamine--corrinoid protein Co-methyltransferase